MFNFENLDEKTRQYMLIEVDTAIRESRLNLSKRLNDTGKAEYSRLLREAVAGGAEQTPADALAAHSCFVTTEKQGTVMRKVRASQRNKAVGNRSSPARPCPGRSRGSGRPVALSHRSPSRRGGTSNSRNQAAAAALGSI